MEKESNISSLKIGGIYTTNFNYFDIIVGIYKEKIYLYWITGDCNTNDIAVEKLKNHLKEHKSHFSYVDKKSNYFQERHNGYLGQISNELLKELENFANIY